MIHRDWPVRLTALSEADVRAIRAAYQAGEWASRLARTYSLSRQAIYNIVNRKSFRDVGEVSE